MKRIAALIRFDRANALRDSLVLYILAAPVILAVAFGFITSSLESSGASFAVDTSTDAGMELAIGLGDYGSVERLRGRDAVERRVMDADDVTGIAWSGRKPVVILQGNEDGNAYGGASRILASVLGGPEASYSLSVRTDARSALRDYSRVALAMLSVLLGGVAAAFSLVDEKESGMTRAYAVTPLSGTDYIAARGLWAGLVGAGGAVVAHFIMGPSDAAFWKLAVALLSSSFIPLSVCLLIGGIASNQIQAVASLKLVMLAALALPFASLAVPQAWTFLFWPFPNFWMFRALAGAYIPGSEGFWLNSAMTALSGAALTLVLARVLKKRLSPGRGHGRGVHA